MSLAQIEGTAIPLRMTEEEFEAWCDEDTRAEFVDGKVVLMSPVSLNHLEVNKFMVKLIDLYLEERPAGRLLGPEFIVRLRSGLRRIPDLFYVAPEHLDRIQPTRLEGAPDAAWEIISADSEQRDWHDKYAEYEASGVREYWIINPVLRNVFLYRLDEAGKYQPVEIEDGRLTSEAIPGLWIRPEWLNRIPLPKIRDCLRELGVL